MSNAGEMNGKEVFVFLSSTFRDMQEERFRLATSTFQQLRYRCEQKGIAFNVVDLRWGITEEESRGGEVLRRCLSEIDRCRPYFVCMLGERYGWCQTRNGPRDETLARTFHAAEKDGHTWLKKYLDRSVTELEIIYGALEPQHSEKVSSDGMRSFCFMRNDLYATKKFDIGDDRRKDFEAESEEHAQKMIALKKRINECGSIATHHYDTPQELTGKMAAVLSEALLSDFPELGDSGDEPDAVAQQAQSAAYHQKQAMTFCRMRGKSVFSQRGKDHKVLVDLCRKALNDKLNNKPIVVTGPSGSGMTGFLANFCAKCEHSADVLPMFGSLTDEATPFRFLQTAERFIKETYGISLPVPESKDDVVQQFPSWLAVAQKALGERRKLVIVIDGIDKVTGDAVHMRWLPLVIPTSIRIVVSTRNTDADGGTFPALAALRDRGSPILELKPWNEPHRKKVAEKYLAGFGKKFNARQMQLFAKHPCTGTAGLVLQSHGGVCGYPVFAALLLDQISSYGTFDALDQQLTHYLSATSIGDLYHLVIADWESAYNSKTAKSLVQDTLSILAICEHGLSDVELMSAVKVKSIEDWAPFFHVLRRSLTQLPDGTFGMHSVQLRHAVSKRYLGSEAKKRACRLRLVSFFESRPLALRTTINEMPQLLMSVVDASARNVAASSVSRLVNFLSDADVFTAMYLGEQRETLFKAWACVRRTDGPSCADTYERIVRQMSARRSVMHPLALFFRDIGDFSTAHSITQRMVSSDRTHHGRESLELAQDLLLGAELAVDLGNLDEASRAAGAALLVFERLAKRARDDVSIRQTMAQFSFMSELSTASPGDDGIRRCLGVRALVCKKKGQYGEAKELYGRAIAHAIQVDAVDSELAELHVLSADVARKLGEYESAQRSYEQALSILTDIYGGSHPVVIRTHRAMALVCKKRGAYKEAQRIYERAIATTVATFGSVHFMHGILLAELADVHRKEDKLDTAQEHYEESLSLLEATVGSEHPEMVDPLMGYGRLLKTRGKYNDARTYYERASEVIEMHYGTTHYKYTTALTLLGDVERKCGNYERAQSLYGEALSAMELALGADHIDVADIWNSMGLAAKKLANYTAARQYYDRALAVRCYHRIRMEESGTPIRRRALIHHAQITTKCLGSGHLKIGVVHVNIGDVLRKQGQYDEAERTLSIARDVIATAVGDEHTEMAEVLHSFGKVYAAQGELDRAREYFSRSIDLIRKLLGSSHPKIGLYMNSLGESLRDSPYEALAIHKKALAQLKAALGASHPEVGDVYVNIGHCHRACGSKREAAGAYNHAIGIVRASLGMEHPKFHQLCKWVGEVGGVVDIARSVPRGRRKARNKRSYGSQRAPQQSVAHAVAAMQIMGWV